MEYDINEALITANTAIVSATGYETTGASIVSQTSGGAQATNHKISLNFSGENTPPSSIVGYGWDPSTGNYTVTHYDRDTKQVTYQVGIGAFTAGSTSDGGSGASEQWSGTSMSAAGSYNVELFVDQPTLLYGNAIAAAAFPTATPAKYPHAYVIITF